jgi:NADH-quinone oxidoreductase subunit C
MVVHVERRDYLRVVTSLRGDGYTYCSDLCAVDYLTHPGRHVPAGVSAQRFEVVVNLLSMSDHKRARVRAQVPSDDPSIDSLFRLYPGTEAMEREVYDLMGIAFVGHPDMTRILMPEDWEGHPLRKDYASGRVPVQFKGAPDSR